MAISVDILPKSSALADGEVPMGPKIGGPSLQNGVNHTNGINGHHVKTVPLEDANKYAIPLNTQFAYTRRRLKVFTIGAGFSGLLMAHKFQHRFPEMKDIVDHTLFEARSDIGGTWLVNHYPGVQCDVPAHIYVSLFPEPVAAGSRLTATGISL